MFLSLSFAPGKTGGPACIVTVQIPELLPFILRVRLVIDFYYCRFFAFTRTFCDGAGLLVHFSDGFNSVQLFSPSVQTHHADMNTMVNNIPIGINTASAQLDYGLSPAC